MKKYFFLAILLTAVFSCEKVIQIDTNDSEPKLVIEANVTNQEGPYLVKLSLSNQLDESNNYPSITNSLVVISDDLGNTDTLTHVMNGEFQTNDLQGVPGRKYTITVNYSGQIYTASSKMPSTVDLNDVLVQEGAIAGQSQRFLVPVFTDPIETGNSYNFNLFINGEKVKSYFSWNDQVNNGEVNFRPLAATDLALSPGDSVLVELQSVTPEAYLYYYTLSQMQSNGPAGGTAPSNPPSNISPFCYGLFSAYATSSKLIVIP